MSYDVTIRRHGISALFDLKGTPDAVRQWTGNCLPPFPATANQMTTAGDVSLCHIGRNHWILRAGIEREPALEQDLNPAAAPADVSIVKISDTLTFFAVTGPDAAAIMAIASPLDLHPSVFGVNAVSFTEAFGIRALVRRLPDGFELGVDQSFGDMVADMLARA
jgi:sarcosine oxidase subunit gamma